MPRNYIPTDHCAGESCTIHDHKLTVKPTVVVWRGGDRVYVGRRDERGEYVPGHAQDKSIPVHLPSVKDFHDLLEHDDFILRILLLLEET